MQCSGSVGQRADTCIKGSRNRSIGSIGKLGVPFPASVPCVRIADKAPAGLSTSGAVASLLCGRNHAAKRSMVIGHALSVSAARSKKQES